MPYRGLLTPHQASNNPITAFGIRRHHLDTEAEPSSQKLALTAHDCFQRAVRVDRCRSDFYQSDLYTKLASDMNDALTQARENYSPDFNPNKVSSPSPGYGWPNY